MATLRFNGSSHYVVGSAPGGLNGAFTVAALVKRTSFVAAGTILSTNGIGPVSGFEFAMGAGNIYVYCDNVGSGTTGTTYHDSFMFDNTDLFIVAMTRGSGETPRFHAINITDALGWDHENGNSAHAADPDAATLAINIGRFDLSGIGIFDFFSGDIGLLAWWDGVEMTDGQIEALTTNMQTSDWHSHAVGAPDSLTQLTSLTPTDLEGLVTWTVSGATLAGDAMSAWDFDGTGPTPEAPVNTVAPVVTGSLPVGSTLSCSTGTWTGVPTPTYTYQWKNGGVNISGETANTYVIVAGDVGDNITCVVTGTNASGTDFESSNTVVPTTASLDILVKVGGTWVAVEAKARVSGAWV